MQRAGQAIKCKAQSLEAMMDSNLSGLWSGWYDYSPGRARTAFSAVLQDRATGLSGSTLEICERGHERTASLLGMRMGTHVSFVKCYDADEPGYENPVHYAGEVSGGGRTIRGQWTLEAGADLFGISLRFTGAFEMVRASDWTGVRAEVGETVAR